MNTKAVYLPRPHAIIKLKGFQTMSCLECAQVLIYKLHLIAHDMAVQAVRGYVVDVPKIKET